MFNQIGNDDGLLPYNYIIQGTNNKQKDHTNVQRRGSVVVVVVELEEDHHNNITYYLLHYKYY